MNWTESENVTVKVKTFFYYRYWNLLLPAVNTNLNEAIVL